jgi:hypothetical protein
MSVNGFSWLFPCLPPSIVMTTCSTFCALGLMPLLLYVYSRGIYDGNLKDKVPYGGIMLSLVMVVIPCTIGIILKTKRPQYVSYIMRVSTSVPTPSPPPCYIVSWEGSNDTQAKRFTLVHSSGGSSPIYQVAQFGLGLWQGWLMWQKHILKHHILDSWTVPYNLGPKVTHSDLWMGVKTILSLSRTQIQEMKSKWADQFKI